MEEKESTDSGSASGNSESESQVMNMAGGITTTTTVAGEIKTDVGLGDSGGRIGGVDSMGTKKKRGRPRKYDSDGNLRLSYISTPPAAAGGVPPPPGFYLTPSPDSSSKRGRGRPPGSGNWQLLASLGGLFADTAGGDFTPHILTVHTGEDVAAKILSLSQKGPRGICVLSANGAVSNVTIRQPGSYGGILTYEGRFEILTLTGSYTISENGGAKSRTGGLSVSLAGPDGRVIGGVVAGLLMAAGPIQMVVGSFMPNGYKMHKKKHHYEPTTIVHTAMEVVPIASPISQALPDIQTTIPTEAQLPVQSSQGGAENGTNYKDNLNHTSTATAADWNGSMHNRPSPDINVSAPME